MAIALMVGVAICFVAAFLKKDVSVPAFDPPFAGQGRAVYGTFTILALAPWAYAGLNPYPTAPQKQSFL